MAKAATVIKLSIQRMACSQCGAEANASCNCGVSYIPKALRAAEAIAANPEKSDRAIAADIGVSPMTVNRARATVPDVTVEERIGLDGKTRRMPEHRVNENEAGNEKDIPSEEEAEESHQQALYDQACLFLEEMTGETRQRFFAHIGRKYERRGYVVIEGECEEIRR
jgi:hypothetical protein